MYILYKKRRSIAIFLIGIISVEFFYTPTAYALTAGASQPEVQTFQPAGVSEMVDLFTGDFNYNIPLFELPGPNGGYPFNLHYQAGVGMDQEASWVGLGFNLNPGAITRQMRGLPDEFKGDAVYTKMAIEPSVTVGLGAGVGVELFGSDNFSLGLGFSLSQNNYTGMGYSIDGSVGYQQAVGSSMTGGVGLNVSLNPKEGLDVRPSLGLDSRMGSTGLEAGYHSRQGLKHLSLTHALRDMKILQNKTTVANKWGTNLSLAHPSYIPAVSKPMNNINIAATFEPGGSWWGIFAAPYISGFYNEQWLKHNKKRVKSEAYGYLNYQYATKEDDLLDFNREKDGKVSKEAPNLAIPSLTYDIYAVNGQGLAAMYRPIRNDYGMIHDPKTVSVSVGGSVGVDVAPAASHGGVNLDVNHSKSTAGQWSEDNQMASRAVFQQKNLNELYEPWYFKGHGEPTPESTEIFTDLGGDAAVRLQLGGSQREPSLNSHFENKSWDKAAPSNNAMNRQRKPRSQVIHPIMNEQLLKGDQEMVPYFDFTFINKNGLEEKFDRSNLPGHHIAGFTALNAEGLRYNYALPAYNLYQEEASYSVLAQPGQTARVDVGNNGDQDPFYQYNGTEKYLKKTELPPYAHAYLLTAIIGPDYVDVTGDGISEDDLGYWVKFTYKKTSDINNPYKWRDPYSKAHYQEGWITDPRDDKGYFVYGEKEMWYLAKAETKSHLAIFEIIPRNDGRGVARKLQDSNEKGEQLYALNTITLFTRAAGNNHPIRTVRFEYDYSLCPGVYNNGSGGGKLTLRKLWFEHGSSQRGRFNPYEFFYTDTNPSYDFYAYDRWGNYKPYVSGDYRQNRDFPYVEQDPSKKEQFDKNAAAWSLKEIIQPSGGKIIIDYETDDYAYVQNKVAMQMAPMVDPYTLSTENGENKFLLNKNDLKIRFPLETPLPSDFPIGQHRDEVMKYLDVESKQLYFKALINLRTPSENFHEYIAGYADIDFVQPMGLEKGTSGEYVYGYFYLKSEEGFHPFSLRAYQHLRINQPELTNSGRKLEQTDNASERISQIKSLSNVGTQIRQMFEGFYNYCSNKEWGKEVVANKSWIRLNTPDKIKYGGGHRVRQLTIKDQWEEDEEGVYGQLYEYITQENGKLISSGVAAYEPLIGGEEIPLRYAKQYVETVPLRSDNNLYFEYPINETYYPGPQVGYSRVQVSSLASAYLAGKDIKNITLSDGEPLFPQGDEITFGTTGVAIHEFYTAKDFPVITDETDKANKAYKLSVMVPFLGNISIAKLASSQGYSIITNDMHGKLKKVSNYRQDKDGAIEPEPISWIKYNYFASDRVYHQKNIKEVANSFKDNEDGTLSIATPEERDNDAIPKATLGQETELFMDTRHFEDNAWTGGARINLDMVYIPLLFVVVPLPVPSVWPRVTKSTTDLKTAVTNKVIFKSGILESIEAYDGGSLVKTNNLKWDKITGKIVLSAVNNNFDSPIYHYNIPAYTKYKGMGPAYQNIGYAFVINNVQVNPYKSDLFSFSTFSTNNAYLQAGDEVLLFNYNGDLVDPIARAVYIGEEEGKQQLFSENPLIASEYKCLVVRAGYRNQLTVSAGEITALEDPSESNDTRIYNKTIAVPKEY